MSRSFLRQPRWIVAHVIIVALTVLFVNLGLWQLDRLAEVEATNARLAERLAQPPIDLASLPDAVAGAGVVDELEYRPVEVRGTYRPEEEVLQRSRAHRGRNGYHVLTPLETADGRSVLVRRGWVPFALDTPPVTEATPPTGEVTVSGYLERSEQQAGFGPTDPAEGVLPRMFRADVPRIDQQVTGELFPMVVHLEAQRPSQPGRLPIPADRPDLDEANHLSYALQWFSFAAIAAIGYAAVLRKRLREPADDPVPDPAATPDRLR